MARERQQNLLTVLLLLSGLQPSDFPRVPLMPYPIRLELREQLFLEVSRFRAAISAIPPQNSLKTRFSQFEDADGQDRLLDLAVIIITNMLYNKGTHSETGHLCCENTAQRCLRGPVCFH